MSLFFAFLNLFFFFVSSCSCGLLSSSVHLAQNGVEDTTPPQHNPPVFFHVKKGGNARFECQQGEENLLEVKWIFKGEDREIGNNSSKYAISTNGTFELYNVTEEDEGIYKCTVVNNEVAPVILRTYSLRIAVSPKFTVKPDPVLETTEGEHDVTLHCQAWGEPMPRIQWDKNNQIINQGEGTRYMLHENGSLQISPVRKEDEGRYGCTAGNSVGFIREEGRLLVKRSGSSLFSLISASSKIVKEDGMEEGNPPVLHVKEAEDSPDAVSRTIPITLTVSVVYMFLVFGLMMWCRYKQVQRKQAYLAAIRKETAGDEEMQEPRQPIGVSVGASPITVVGPSSVKSDRSSNSNKTQNNKITTATSITTTASVASHRSNTSSKSKSSGGGGLNEITFSREGLQFVMLLGQGQFGEVFLAKPTREMAQPSQSLVMIKSLQTREENALFEYKREIDMYHKLDHENVAKLVGICKDMEPHYMVMEYSDWGDLKQFLLATRPDNVPLPSGRPKPPPLSTPQIINIISQVALGMEHLSNHRFIHKDLATRNCLISFGLRIKISNPSLSKDTYAQEYFKYKNQPMPIRWLPPEAILEDDFSTKSDVWSFGVLSWEVIRKGSLPFSQMSNEEILSAMERKELRWRIEEEEEGTLYPIGLKKILKQCWDHNPKNRGNFSTIVIQLSEINVSNKSKAEIGTGG